MIDYKSLARVRREAENLLIIVDELQKKGIPKELIINMIIDESRESNKENESFKKDE